MVIPESRQIWKEKSTGREIRYNGCQKICSPTSETGEFFTWLDTNQSDSIETGFTDRFEFVSDSAVSE
ncbi:MAG: hypothetical protein NTW79_00445 [Candidatus Berkelbacteria bacterium]|nr:hypothetical protein [Candidatus Berkelbacteria bacterium]